MMKGRCAVVGILVLVVSNACSRSANDPRAVATAFWEATQAGDYGLATSYALESASSTHRQLDGDSSIEAFSLGETTVDGEEATVETTVTTKAKHGAIHVNCLTILVRERGEWRVDLRRTTREFAENFIGQSLSDMAEQTGKAIGKAMGSAMQGIRDGMEQETKSPDLRTREETETP